MNEELSEDQTTDELVTQVHQKLVEKLSSENKRLNESEERFRLISEQSLLAINIVQEGKIVYVNEAWESLTGFSIEEMKDWEPYHFVGMTHPDDRERLVEQLKKKQGGLDGYSLNNQYRFFNRSGELKWISIYSKTISYMGGTADLATCIDITEQKKAERSLQESEERLRAVFNSAEDAIFLKDMECRYTQVNPAMEKLLGLPSEQIIGKREVEVMPESVAQRVREEDAKVLEGASVDEESYLEFNGSRRYFHNLKVPLTNEEGEVIGLCGVSRDVTLRKTAALAKEKQLRTEAENSAKTEFLARVSHELRTPLNAIIGYSEMLLEDAEEEDADRYSGDLRKILDAGDHLLGLINDILDMSKVESGSMDLFIEKVSIEEVIEEVVSIIKPLVQKNENQFKVISELPTGLEMSVDRTKLRQVLLNLLSNASKFTRKGTVTLKVEELKEASSPEIKFSVRDEGIGIDQSKMTKIFQRFTQADEDTTMKFGGTGLGLPITKAFLEMMGGSIEVISEIGKGSTFEVTLPRGFLKPEKKSKS